MHGQFTWYELTTPDVDAAKKFYPRFTGWGLQPFDKDYTMFTSGGVPVAGIFRLSDDMRQQGVPPNWMPYIEADNIDETAAKASSLGAQVTVPPSDIPNMGRFAVIQDPQGAMFGIYKGSGPSNSWDGTAVVGRPSWLELMTRDYSKAFEFYRALFGWNMVSEMDMGDAGKYFMYGHGDKMYGGMFNQTGDMLNMHPFWLVYIHVPDVGKAVATATKAGGKIHRPQMDIPGGSIAILGDPQGAGFALHHASAQPAAATSAPPAKKATKKAATKATKKGAKKAARKAAPKKAAAKKSPKKAAAKKPAKAARRSAPKAKGKAAKKTSAKRTRRAAKKR